MSGAQIIDLFDALSQSLKPRVSERPILFTGELIPRVMDGTKTQTRRLLKSPNLEDLEEFVRFQRYPDESYRAVFAYDGGNEDVSVRSPYGGPGDRLWVRETFWHHKSDYLEQVAWPGLSVTRNPDGGAYAPHINKSFDPREHKLWRKRPSIHMPRWASRTLLEVVDVRVQRLQDITEEDARAEGVDPVPCTHPDPTPGYGCTDCQGSGYVEPALLGFASLWDSINAKRASWEANPLVWAITFKRCEP